jgi:glycosyltransferase involved in cell wall biosynthesis
MRIGIIIGRIGGLDGVALETEKWIEVLWRMGHEVFVLTGQVEMREPDRKYETIFPVLSFFSPECLHEQSKAFYHPDVDPKPLIDQLEKTSDLIAKEIVWWAIGNRIDLLISENASALPSHLSMGMGIRKAVHHIGLKVITHDHDFAWERGTRYLSRHRQINRMIAETFPLKYNNVRRAVINKNAQKDLKEKFGYDSIVVPNVMDFEVEYGVKGPSNEHLREDLGIAEDDIMLAQVTRIVRRKGIEVAIELVSKLKNPKVKLVITGNYNDDNDGEYSRFLAQKIKDYGLEDQIIFAAKFLQENFGESDSVERKYTLSDIYAQADACTYFSTYEGFGNAFVEAVLARKPIFVNNYKPVFWPDIGSLGFDVVMLENNELTPEKVDAMAAVLADKKRQKEIADFNFELGKKYFSYEALTEKLNLLLKLSLDDYRKRLKNTLSL